MKDHIHYAYVPWKEPIIWAILVIGITLAVIAAIYTPSMECVYVTEGEE